MTLAVAAITAVLAATPSCRRPATPPNILLITVDTLRADHCSAYGYARPTTPNLERLAARGVRFATAYAPTATTGPSHATMFTGLWPRSHGVVRNGQPLDARFRTVAEAFQERGYQTGAVVSSFAVNHRFGLVQGFASYDDDFGAPRPGQAGRWEGHAVPGAFDRTGDRTRSAAVDWLRREGYLDRSTGAAAARKPFFLWVHLFDPHHPYTPPAAQGALFPPLTSPATEIDREVAAYDAEVRFADEQIGLLTDELAKAGRFDDVLTMVTADHGEGLMQHGHMFHGIHLYEEAVRVPWVVHWPARIPSGSVIDEPVQLLDLAPTLLGLAGVASPGAGMQGKDLASVIAGRARPEPLREVFLQRRFFDKPVVAGVVVKGSKVGVRVGRWKYIEAPEEGTSELYDLEADPGERDNLHARSAPEATRFKALIERWQQSTPAAGPPTPVSAEDAEALRSLGYVQ